MARYKLVGNELVDITNKNKTNSTPTSYKIAQNKDKMLTQINHRKTNDSTTMYKIENEFRLKNEVNKNRRKYIDSKNILADNLNNQGLNVNRNNPFQANVNSNNLINNSRTNLNGIVTLNDVVNNQKNALENNKELVNNVNNSMYDYAKSNYLYNKQKVDNDNVTLYDKTLGTAVRGVSDLFSNIITPTSYIIDENGRKIKAPTYNELKQSKVSENYNTGVGKFLGDATYNMSKILGSQAINAVTGGVGGTALYWSDMFFDNYHSSVRDGHDNNNAMAYALASTAAEYLTGKFLGSATKQLTGGKTNDYEQLLDKVFTKFISNKNVTTFLSNAGSEATEEFIQEYLDNINKNLILGENNKVFSLDTLADAVYSAGLGAISGGTIGLLNSKIYGETPDTNVIPDDITENIEEKKSNIDVSSDIYENEKTVNENNIKSNIDNKITSNTEIENIVNEINEYQQLKNENKLTSKQEQYLNQLKQKLNELQNTNMYTESSSQTSQILPTVQDIVNQEQTTKNTSINLPVDNQQSIISNMNNANSEALSSSKKILPTINDFNGSNINIPTSNIKIDMTKIKPEILEDIKGFKLGDPNIESYKGSYIKTMLNEVGIKVPNAMNYVSEVRPDMSFTTTKDLTRQQYASVSNALQKLRSVDVTSVNNANYSIPISNYQYVKSNNININELRRTASMYLNNTARSNNTIRLLESIIKDRNYIIRFNPNITNEQGVSVDGLITKDNGKIVIELNPNSSNYVEFLVVHEITHDIATKEIKELILDYAKQDSKFEETLESLKERYKTNDVSDEVVADVCGELFGNREFIQSVVEKKPSIFKRILNNIKKLAEKIKGTGANEYVSFVEKLKTMWEDAYYSNRSTLNETKYMMTGIKGTKNAIKTDASNEFLIESYNKAQDLKSSGLSNKLIRQKTGWFQDNNGDWKFEISDEDANIKVNLEKNKSYKLGDILEHQELFEMYPKLKNNKVKFSYIENNIINNKNYEIRGKVNKITDTITLNNNLIGKGNEAILDTLIHELQHRIQKIEGFQRGTSASLGLERYKNNLGEIEARDTQQRRKLNYNERKKLIPNILNQNNNNFVEKNNNNSYNIFEENYEEDNSKNSSINSFNFRDGRYSNIRRGNEQNNARFKEELDDSSFSLEQRVSGDKLLDTQDLIEEIKMVGAKVDKNGYVTLYHQTTSENADKIKQSGKMFAKEPYVYFSTSENASQSDGRGNTKLEFKIPAEKLILDDIFDDNADVKIKLDSGKELDVSNYIVKENNDLNKYIFDNDFYNQFKYEDKAKITKTISELKSEKEKLAPDANEDDWVKYYHLNTKIKALENGYNSEYDYIVGKEKERLIKDYEFGKLTKQIEEKKRLEAKNNQLQQDIKESTQFKNAQYKIIQETNPMFDEEHVGIRSPKDIKTFEEAINDEDSFAWGDYSKEDAIRDLKKGTVTIYSSYPIKNGTFVSTSYQQALDYAGGDPTQVHSRRASLNSVAWINCDEGQYAKVYDILPTKYSQSTKEWNEYLKDNFPSAGTKTKMSDIKLPIREDIKSSSKKNKILNPNEISKLTKDDANTTPILPVRGTINKVNDGDSHFANNIREKVNMLNADQKTKILSSDDVRYYDKVTNKESLEKAFKKINDGGSSESSRWFNTKARDMDATDVAEGWILLKQYADNGDYNSMVEVAKKMREIGTTAGQTVQAFNIMERMTPEGMVKYAQSELSEAYDKMVKNKSKEWIDKYREDFDLKPNEVQFIMDNMKEVQNMEDGYDKRVKLAEIQKLMTDKLPPEKGAKIKSWMRISMLFNPKTQVRNVAGNALIMPINSFGDLFSSYADKLIAKKTGVRTTGNTNIKAMLKGIKKGAYEATNDYKKGINTKDMEGNRFEISDGKSFSEKNLMGKTLNRTESLLNYVMDVGDRVFSEAAFENSLQNQLVLNNTTEITQEMIDIAHQEALSRTWNDNNNYTKFVLNARAGLNQFANIRGYGLGDVLIPFAKTPANLTKAIVDYSPAGLVSTINKGINLKKSLTNGQYTATMQHEFVQSLGKATAGTILYILGIALAKAGITSGKSDDDKDTANFLKNTLGISSYSIKIGNKSFTYDWAQPLAAPLSITANVVNSKSSDTKALLEGIIGSLDTAGSILLEQSFLQSIKDVLSDNDGVVSGIVNEVLQLPARAVPTFSKQIADLVDGTQRTSFEYGKPVQSAINSIKAKIPFVSKTLNPTIDTMGREIQKYGGKNNIFNVFLNPANVNTENISKSAEEIYRLYKETGETDVMPRVAPYYINQKGEKVMMSGKDRVEYQKVSGKIIEDNIKKLINSTSYSNMSDLDKANVVKDIVDYSYNIAKKDVLGLELSNTYQKAYEYSKIGDIGDYYTFKESIDNTDKDTKKASVTKFLINSDLNNEQLAYLYGNYYSSDKVLNTLVQSNIPIKEYIKFNSETFDSDYYTNGKTVPNSRKNKVIKYINSLNLSIPQKAMLIKMEYSSFKQYDNQIVKYVNSINCSSYDKKIILKTIGFTSYDKDIINTINSKNISIEEKTKELEELGFKVRNGKVYTK